MDKPSKDIVSYDVKNSFAYFEVLRTSDGVESRVHSTQAPDFTSALTQLIDYHNLCLMYHNTTGEKKVYSGGGSGRGRWFDTELREWELKDVSILPRSEKVLLERIVSLHNQVVSHAFKIDSNEDNLCKS